MTGIRQGYAERAAAAVIEAARAEHDFGGWLAAVVGTAAELGSSRALTASRPGSWEADLVMGLVCGTVGWNDEYRHTARDGDPMTGLGGTAGERPTTGTREEREEER